MREDPRDLLKDYNQKSEDKTKKNLLHEAWLYCDVEDKSTEFMITYMQDYANVDFDYVMNFIENTTDEERTKWIKNNSNK